MGLGLLFMHANAAFLGYGGCVDAVDVFRALQQAFNGRVAHQFGLGIGKAATVGEMDGFNATLACLRKE